MVNLHFPLLAFLLSSIFLVIILFTEERFPRSYCMLDKKNSHRQKVDFKYILADIYIPLSSKFSRKISAFLYLGEEEII